METEQAIADLIMYITYSLTIGLIFYAIYDFSKGIYFFFFAKDDPSLILNNKNIEFLKSFLPDYFNNYKYSINVFASMEKARIHTFSDEHSKIAKLTVGSKTVLGHCCTSTFDDGSIEFAFINIYAARIFDKTSDGFNRNRDLEKIYSVLSFLHEIRHMHQFSANTELTNYLISNDRTSEKDAERYSKYILIKNYKEIAKYFEIKLTLEEFKNSKAFNANLDAWYTNNYTDTFKRKTNLSKLKRKINFDKYFKSYIQTKRKFNILKDNLSFSKI